MNPPTLETCPGCGLIAFRAEEGPFGSAERFGASTSCWSAFSDVLRLEYESPVLFLDVHSLTVDSYAAQHPQALADESLAMHLIRLHCIFELGYDTTRASARVRRFTRRGRDYEHLDPPARPGDLTVVHVLSAESELDHVRRVWEWAESVWQSWAGHHPQVARWARRAG